MGCFASTNKSPSPQNHSTFDSNRAPPQSLPLLEIEEETVKEVLSETPTIKPAIPELPNKIVSDSPTTREVNNDIVDKKSDVHRISEIFSNLNQRNSPAIGVTDNGDVRQRVERSPSKSRNRSFSSNLSSHKETGKSPVRRPEPSPGRVRLTPGREWRKDAGESSGRKTMSPVRYTDGGSARFDLGRSPSMRKTGKSPSRIRPEKNRKVEESSKRPPTANESLENPLVSLECFIFL